MNQHDGRAEGRDRTTGRQDIRTGDTSARPVTVTVINYSESHLEEQICARLEDIQGLILRPTVTWINVDGVHDAEVIQAIGSAAGIHPLTLEDIVNTSQRPKMEDYGDYLYVVARMLSPDGDDEFRSEQVSLVFGAGYVGSLQEQPGVVFARIREHLRAGAGRLRTEGAGFLFYAMLDAIVGGYFTVIEVFGEHIEMVEDEVVAEPDRGTLQAIYALKRSLIALRRSVWPLRDVMAELERGDSLLIPDSMLVYLRDVYDHTIQVAETVETYREMISGLLLDVYLSSQSSQTNEIMKVLTIIATIFISLTFIAGVYGTNFTHTPELRHPWGYPSSACVDGRCRGPDAPLFQKEGVAMIGISTGYHQPRSCPHPWMIHTVSGETGGSARVWRRVPGGDFGGARHPLETHGRLPAPSRCCSGRQEALRRTRGVFHGKMAGPALQ